MVKKDYKTYAVDSSTGAIGPERFLAPIKTTLAVYDYLNNSVIVRRLQNLIGHVKTELSNVQHLTGETHDLASLWSSFMATRLDELKSNGQK
jgi:hypothetical protein